MKVFEYSWETGKGDQIDNLKYSGVGGQLGMHRGVQVHSSLITINYEKTEDIFENTTADEYNVDAITFCTGRNFKDDGWHWVILPCEAMIIKAVKRNERVYGAPYHVG